MIFEATYTRTWVKAFEAESLIDAKVKAQEYLGAYESLGGKVTLGHVESQESRLEWERRDAEYKEWKAVRDAAWSQHPMLEKRTDGSYECTGCLRTEETVEAFLDTSCLGWALDLLELSGRHDAGDHNWTTRVQIGGDDAPRGPETNIYDRSCPRCIEARMKAGTPATASGRVRSYR